MMKKNGAIQACECTNMHAFDSLDSSLSSSRAKHMLFWAVDQLWQIAEHVKPCKRDNSHRVIINLFYSFYHNFILNYISSMFEYDVSIGKSLLKTELTGRTGTISKDMSFITYFK